MAENRRACFFVGAGFSRAMFLQEVTAGLGRSFVKWDDDQATSCLPERVRQLLVDVSDFELVMSHWQNLWIASIEGNGPREDRGLRHDQMTFRVALARYFAECFEQRSRKDEDRRVDSFRRYLGSRRLGPSDLSFVTTNYDLALEHLLERCFGEGSWVYPGLQPDQGDRIPIHKLHGSVSVLEDRGSGEKMTRKPDGELVVALDLDAYELHPHRKGGLVFGSQDGRKWIPVLIPLVYQKGYWAGNDNDAWRKHFRNIRTRAEADIRSASRVEFWGYSLPAADHETFTSLCRSLHENQTVRIVTKGDAPPVLRELVRSRCSRPAKCFEHGLSEYLELQVVSAHSAAATSRSPRCSSSPA